MGVAAIVNEMCWPDPSKTYGRLIGFTQLRRFYSITTLECSIRINVLLELIFSNLS